VYWSLRSIPELSDLPRAERRRLWRECWWKVLGHWQVWLVFLVGLLGLLGGTVLVPFLALACEFGLPLALLLVSGVWGSLFGFLLNQVSIPLARPYLRAARASGRSPAQQP
jgi:hypothetical protein